MRELGRHGRHRLFQSLTKSVRPLLARLPVVDHQPGPSLTRHPRPAVRFVPVDLRAYRKYAMCGILATSVPAADPFCRLIVMPLDLTQVGRLAESRMRIEVPGVCPQVPVVAEPAQV